MRLLVILSITFLAGLVLGTATQRCFFAGADGLVVPDEAAIVHLRSPGFDELDVGDQAGLDGVWQRMINNRVFYLKNNKVFLRDVLREPDVQRTGWFQSFSDDSQRLEALQADLLIEQVPATSYILISFDAAPGDARIIANSVTLKYLHLADREALDDHRAKLNEFSDAITRLRRREDDLRTEAASVHEPWVLEERHLELKGIIEKRLEVTRELEEERERFSEVSTTVRLVRFGIDPTATVEF